jgi:membrane protein
VDDDQANEQAGAGRKSMTRPSDWKEIGKEVWTKSGEDNVSIVASGIAFNAFLAFVPFLTSVVLTYGLIAAPEQVAGHIERLSQVMPEDAADIVGSQLENMVETAGSTIGLGLLMTLGLSLYGALRGASGIISGLNIVFNVEESRSFIQQTGVAIAITIGLIFTFILASAGIAVLGLLSDILPDLGGMVHSLLEIGFWIAAGAAVCVVVALIYRLAPDRGNLEWRWLTPGSVLATGTWLIATFAFGIYVQNFGDYQAVYGALGAIIIFLIWLYLSAYILLLGAELNQVLAERKEKTQ